MPSFREADYEDEVTLFLSTGVVVSPEDVIMFLKGHLNDCDELED